MISFLSSLRPSLESPYHLAAVSGAHFTQGMILIVILVSSGSAKSKNPPVYCGWLSRNSKGMAWKTESMQNMDV